MKNSQMLALACSDILDGTRYQQAIVFLFSYTLNKIRLQTRRSS
jgi:hypothetical protein